MAGTEHLSHPLNRGIRRGKEPGFAIRARGHGTTPLKVKEDDEDVSSELGNGGVKGCTSWMKRPELYFSRRVLI
ncbi:hypothetical protein TNCV_4209501 [Trichonephila clavipes]|nr:hypothetical protein TNCV_4209501 [Trichonephila clavipes]